MNKFFVYILKSEKLDNWYYVGMTKNLNNRLADHNSGRVKSTKFRRPYKIIYSEEFDNRPEARKREKQLKNGNYKKRFINSLKNMGS